MNKESGNISVKLKGQYRNEFLNLITRNAFLNKTCFKRGALEYAEYAFFFGVTINKKELYLAALYCFKKSFKKTLPPIIILYTIYNGILTLFVEL